MTQSELARPVSALPIEPIFFPEFRRGSARARATADGARWTKRYQRLVATTDALVILSVAVAAHLTRFGFNTTTDVYVGQFPVGYVAINLITAVAWFAALGVYRSRDARTVGMGTDEYKRVVGATVTLLGVVAMLCFLLHIDIARGFFALAFPAGTTSLLLSRWLMRRWLSLQRRRGHYLCRVVVLGGADEVLYVANQLSKKSGAAYEVAGVVLTGHDRPPVMNIQGITVPVVGDERHVIPAVAAVGADAVIVAGPVDGGPKFVQSLGWELEQSSTELILTTGLTNVAGPRIHARPIEGLPLMHVELPQYTGPKHAMKRLFDVAMAAVGLVLLAPLFAVLALLVRLDSPGPVLFRQERVGRGGTRFPMLKFRSMVQTAESDLAALIDRNQGSGLLFKLADDPRVTRVGRWMRKYSLDELPQLWNVVRGDMSLVGPRPPLQREVDRYQTSVHRRLYIKPGLTGMWQINGRSDLSWEESVRLDLYYVENWSLTGDVFILLRTVRMLFNPVGAY